MYLFVLPDDSQSLAEPRQRDDDDNIAAVEELRNVVSRRNGLLLNSESAIWLLAFSWSLISHHQLQDFLPFFEVLTSSSAAS